GPCQTSITRFFESQSQAREKNKCLVIIFRSITRLESCWFHNGPHKQRVIRVTIFEGAVGKMTIQKPHSSKVHSRKFTPSKSDAYEPSSCKATFGECDSAKDRALQFSSVEGNLLEFA